MEILFFSANTDDIVNKINHICFVLIKSDLRYKKRLDTRVFQSHFYFLYILWDWNARTAAKQRALRYDGGSVPEICLLHRKYVKIKRTELHTHKHTCNVVRFFYNSARTIYRISYRCLRPGNYSWQLWKRPNDDCVVLFIFNESPRGVIRWRWNEWPT